jgi:hypothetical protein
VRAITRCASPKSEADLVQVAKHGTVTISVRATPDASATILQAIDAATGELPDLVDGPEATHAARRCDALEHIAASWLQPDPRTAPKTEVVVHAERGRSRLRCGD